jgi:hypothetical protein
MKVYLSDKSSNTHIVEIEYHYELPHLIKWREEYFCLSMVFEYTEGGIRASYYSPSFYNADEAIEEGRIR